MLRYLVSLGFPKTRPRHWSGIHAMPFIHISTKWRRQSNDSHPAQWGSELQSFSHMFCMRFKDLRLRWRTDGWIHPWSWEGVLFFPTKKHSQTTWLGCDGTTRKTSWVTKCAIFSWSRLIHQFTITFFTILKLDHNPFLFAKHLGFASKLVLNGNGLEEPKNDCLEGDFCPFKKDNFQVPVVSFQVCKFAY